MRGVQRAKLSVRERGCVLDFLASRGGDLNLNFEPTRLRIPSVPCIKLSSPHNERAQNVLLTIVSDQKLPQKFHFLSQLSVPIKTGLRQKYSKTLYFDENTPKILYFDV